MAAPLVPTLHGPITPSAPAARVSAVAPDATVELLAGGAVVGVAQSAAGGAVWVPIAGPLAPGQEVTARQRTPGGTSEESRPPVPVVAVPDPLPVPVFVSPLSTCMSMLRLDGLVPGATVVLRQGAAVVGTAQAGRTTDFVPIDPAADLNPGARLEASQELAQGGAVLKSDPAPSMPIPQTRRENALPAPGIARPVAACRTALDFLGMTTSAEVVLENEGQAMSWLNVAEAYTGWGGPPLRQGRLRARQRFARCEMESAETAVEVGPPAEPGRPVIRGEVCPKLGEVRIDGLVPPALVVVSAVTPDPSTPGAVVFTPIGEATASTASQTFTLPAGIETVTPTGAPVLLSAVQTLCGVQSVPSLYVGFSTPGGPYGAPAITPPLVDCARRIAVTGARPGSRLQAFHEDDGAPISDPVFATAPDQVLTPWFPLVAGRGVTVRQTGCDADGDAPPRKVEPLPAPFPDPVVQGPVRPSAPTVAVKGCVPGARLHLLVNGAARASIDVLSEEAVVPVPSPPLVEGDALWAVQTLCAAASALEGRATPVTKGQMKVEPSPATVTRGTTATVTVTARDADTGVPVAGAQVLLDGKAVGKTGVPFAFAPAPGQPNPAGVVREPVAHLDAPFTIQLVDPPPKPLGRLSLNVGPATLVPNALRLVSASWTVTSLWTPAASATATGANASVALPDPPPAPADRRVSVHLSTTWEVAGTINGVGFQYQKFPGHMDPDPTHLAWDGQDLTAGWLALWDILYDEDGNALLVVFTRYQGAE
jgi:hypothetical protein